MGLLSLMLACLICGCLGRRIPQAVNGQSWVSYAGASQSRSFRPESPPTALNNLLLAVRPPVDFRARTPMQRRTLLPAAASARLPVETPRRTSEVKAVATIPAPSRVQLKEAEAVDTGTKATDLPPTPSRLALKEAAVAAKRDIDDILVREPNWNNYAPDVTLKDSSGNQLGAQYIRNLLKALRKFRSKFVTKDYVRVRGTIRGDVMPELITQGTLELQGIGLPIPSPFGAFRVKVEGTATIRFNSDAKVREMEIGEWRINGKKCDLPVLTGTDPDDLSWQDKASLLGWAARTITC